jgi:hypothetical protein
MADYSDDNINNDNQDFGDFNRNFDDDTINNNADKNNSYLNNDTNNDIIKKNDVSYNYNSGNSIQIETSSKKQKQVKSSNFKKNNVRNTGSDNSLQNKIKAVKIITAIGFLLIMFYYTFWDFSFRTELKCNYKTGCSYSEYNVCGFKFLSKSFSREDISGVYYTYRTDARGYRYTVFLKNSDYFYVTKDIYSLLSDYYNSKKDYDLIDFDDDLQNDYNSIDYSKAYSVTLEDVTAIVIFIPILVVIFRLIVQ